MDEKKLNDKALRFANNESGGPSSDTRLMYAFIIVLVILLILFLY